MDIDEIRSDLRKFVREQYAVPETDLEFSEDVNLFNYGYIDSFGAVELTEFIAQRFGIRFTDSDWATVSLSSIREISTFIAKRLDNRD
jgi:methoxymalonate biosynthesis acyl carrier protein